MVKDLVKNLCVSLETDIGGVSGATSRKVVVATPVITLTGNSVTITCDTTGATIYYTLDGSTPTSSSSQYSSAFTLDSSCTIKAIAIKGGKSSGIAEEEYVKPITYLTQWKIVGNSEVHGNEIWSCGEYNPIDGKYHILVQPLGGSIADIALTEPLRKIENISDTIEFPSDTEGKALVTRNIQSYIITQSSDIGWNNTNTESTKRMSLRDLSGLTLTPSGNNSNVLCPLYRSLSAGGTYSSNGIAISNGNNGVTIRDANYDSLTQESQNAFKAHVMGMEVLYVAVTPTTELVDAPQIQEAESYTCVISQGAKSVEWSDFVTE